MKNNRGKYGFAMMPERWTMMLLVFIVYHCSLATIYAQQISVSAPSQVSAGENFRVAYTINTQDVEEFRSVGPVEFELPLFQSPFGCGMSKRRSSFGKTMLENYMSQSPFGC